MYQRNSSPSDYPVPRANHKFIDERDAGIRYKSADTWTPTVTYALQQPM